MPSSPAFWSQVLTIIYFLVPLLQVWQKKRNKETTTRQLYQSSVFSRSLSLKSATITTKCQITNSQNKIIVMSLSRLRKAPGRWLESLSKWRRRGRWVSTKGQLNSEWIYEVIVSSKMPTKNYQDFCPGSLLEGRAEISIIFGWDFGRNDDLINSFWI